MSQKHVWYVIGSFGSYNLLNMVRATLPFILLIILIGIPAIITGTAYLGQVLFAMLLVLFLGTLADAFADRVQDDH